MADTKYLTRLASCLPQRHVNLLETGCCGMAGGFGMLKSKMELSLKVGAPLAEQRKTLPFNTAVVASGTRGRHQIAHMVNVHLKHMAELLAESLVLPSA